MAEETFKCQYCEWSSTRQSSYKVHLNKKHGKGDINNGAKSPIKEQQEEPQQPMEQQQQQEEKTVKTTEKQEADVDTK